MFYFIHRKIKESESKDKIVGMVLKLIEIIVNTNGSASIVVLHLPVC